MSSSVTAIAEGTPRKRSSIFGPPPFYLCDANDMLMDFNLYSAVRRCYCAMVFSAPYIFSLAAFVFFRKVYCAMTRWRLSFQSMKLIMSVDSRVFMALNLS